MCCLASAREYLFEIVRVAEMLLPLNVCLQITANLLLADACFCLGAQHLNPQHSNRIISGPGHSNAHAQVMFLLLKTLQTLHLQQQAQLVREARACRACDVLTRWPQE
jgi:hypothetical protein